MRSVSFDYTLWGVDEVTDLCVEADVELRPGTVVLRSVTIAATGEAFTPDDETRRCLVTDAIELAAEERDQELFERRAS